jgi:hypothetical protein
VNEQEYVTVIARLLGFCRNDVDNEGRQKAPGSPATQSEILARPPAPLLEEIALILTTSVAVNQAVVK